MLPVAMHHVTLAEPCPDVNICQSMSKLLQRAARSNLSKIISQTIGISAILNTIQY